MPIVEFEFPEVGCSTFYFKCPACMPREFLEVVFDDEGYLLTVRFQSGDPMVLLSAIVANEDAHSAKTQQDMSRQLECASQVLPAKSRKPATPRKPAKLRTAAHGSEAAHGN